MPIIYYKDTTGTKYPCEVLSKTFDTYRIKYITEKGELTRLAAKEHLIFPKFSELVF